MLFPFTLLSQIWKPLGAGFDAPPVWDLHILNNQLYSGGSFFMSGSTNVYTIAKWDGVSWTSIGFSSPFGAVTSIGKFNNDLVVAGDFQSVNGNYSSRRIARYDGATWHSLNTGITNGGSYYCFLEYNGDLLVGGEFNIVDGINMKNLARWDGSSWYSFATVAGTFSQIHDMIIYNNELYIGGYFSSVNGQTIVNIAKFDGTTWSDVGGGLSSDVIAFAIDSVNNRLYAGGNFTGIYNTSTVFPSRVAYWDGSNWYAVGGAPAISPRALCFYKGSLYAGFSFEAIKPNGDTLKHMAVWDGNEWQPTNGNLNDIVKDFCVLNNDLIVGGAFTVAGDSVVNYIAAYTDTTTGITSLNTKTESFTITPNPANSTITIYSGSKFTSYTIASTTGSKIKSKKVKPTDSFEINIAALAKGAYILTINNGKEEASQRFMKE